MSRQKPVEAEQTVASAVKEVLAPKEIPVIKLDLGCGKNKKEGFLGIDCRKFPGVDGICDLFVAPWEFDVDFLDKHFPVDGDSTDYKLPDSCVTEVHCSHFLEHLTGLQRVQFLNELHRVLIPGGKALIITPHWASNRAYGDFTHQWPPVSEMFYYYLSKQWRKDNAPHNDIEWNPQGYKCDFAATWGYSVHPQIQSRNKENQDFAFTFYKEAAQDIHATIVAVK